MLNTAERFKILKVIKSSCIFGCFPVVVDLSSWQLQQTRTTGRKRWFQLGYFALFVLHVGYKTGTLLADCLAQQDQESKPLYQLIIHGILAFTGPIMVFWYYQLFINHPGEYNIFLHATLTGKIGGVMTTEKERQKGNIVSRLKDYTLQDLIAIYLPSMLAPTFVAISILYVCYPSLGFLLYARLPQQFQTWLSFGVLLLEEQRFVLMACVLTVPVWTLQVISFDLINNQLKRLIGSIDRGTSRQRLARVYACLRYIQLYVAITNVVNRYIIFSWKLLCIGASIVTGYAAIAHFSDYPVFGVMYYLILIDDTLIYTVCYDKAFRIPNLFQDTAKLALLRWGQGRYEGLRAFKRQMRSIPRVGIKVGEFHVLERESTPTFLHYVLSNIVSMLVAYRH